MVLIGMLHHRKHPDMVKKAYPFAAVAKMEGIDFIYFTFNDIDFEGEIVNGWIYEKGEWVQTEKKIPKVIINSCNPKNEEHSLILRRLKTTAVFTSFSVGNKYKVYNKVKKAETFASYLIPSKTIQHSNDLLSFLESHHAAVMKPVSGNRGRRIFFIKKTNEGYQWTDGSITHVFDKKELTAAISQPLEEQRYLLQPYIECKTKSGLTYDFRLHVQKNGNGQWEITLIYPRISGNTRMVSNISSGGYRGELIPFLKDEFQQDYRKMKKNLETFALSFAAHLDTLYENPFDELGIDVGIDHQQKLWLFEVNWRPGAKNREFQVAKRLIPYCRFLAEMNE
ncbi:YheC/YheD family protein [Neobacillus mesonae]|uniref:YheC/YheD family endospore coat-associated protein n=1 Tax=Neobacillus mesonae TaxID=1193713 RepID=UPI00203DC650|nr:YheC/YheD family protein [Neobacillus mesonae]MCM3571042.1 YheC/YheD family protein [Neobacillus mesonae]